MSHLVRGDLCLCMELAGEAVALAERVSDPGMMMEALFLPTVTLVFRGEFAAARDHCARALADYDDRDRTRFWAAVTGADSGVAHRCYLSVALWHLGSVDQALKLNAEALALARALGHPFTLAFALGAPAWLHNQCRLAASPGSRGVRNRRRDRPGIRILACFGALFGADSLVLQGRWNGHLPPLLKGLKPRATGTGRPTFHLGFLGDAHTRAGRFEDGIMRRRGSGRADKSDERFYEAELHRLAGELFLAWSLTNGTAEACFSKPLVLRCQQSKAVKLGTMSLARPGNSMASAMRLAGC